MTFYLLPTSDIVRAVKEFETLFSFYEGGIKNVIRDAVILSTGYNVPDYPESLKLKPVERTTGLRDKILNDYQNSVEAKIREHTCFPDNSLLIEIVIDNIETMVEYMMHGVFVKTIYDVCVERARWFGSDLAIVIEVYQ